MKRYFIFMFVGLAAWLPLSLSSAPMGQLWQGPRKTVRWLGLSVIHTPPAQKRISATSSSNADVDALIPRWVGYARRSGDFFFRFQLSTKQVEMVRRGGRTSDGWLVSGCQTRANRPTSVTVSRNGVEKILTLVPAIPSSTK